jgi:hypothetical protein
MFEFLLSMWLQNKLTSSQVDKAVSLGKITKEEGTKIKNTNR